VKETHQEERPKGEGLVVQINGPAGIGTTKGGQRYMRVFYTGGYF